MPRVPVDRVRHLPSPATGPLPADGCTVVRALARKCLVMLLLAAPAGPVSAAEPSTYAGVEGAELLDSGQIVVRSSGPLARVEQFEYLRRPDGGITLLNTITASDGSYRVRGRFDYDAEWMPLGADGVGIYDGTPVRIRMRPGDGVVDIRVEGPQPAIRARGACDPDCLINMSPSVTAMFTMTRRYDRAAGGEQLFRWVGQDLDRRRTLSGGKSRIRYRGRIPVEHAGGTLDVQHFSFVEQLPAPDGGTFTLDFDLWADADGWPLGFRVRTAGGRPGGTVGFRSGYDDVRAAVTESG